MKNLIILTAIILITGCTTSRYNSNSRSTPIPKQYSNNSKGTPVCHEDCYFKSFQVKQPSKGNSCYKF